MRKPPVYKGMQKKVHIQSLNQEGQGVARVDGFVIFVEGALPGEDAVIQIVKVTSKFAIAKMRSYDTPSKLRTDPPCPYFKRCGGCQLMHIKYKGQLLYKQKQIMDVLRKVGGIHDDVVLPVIGMDKPYYYRNKVVFNIAQGEEDPVIGFNGRHSHRVVDVEQCLISDKIINQILKAVRSWMRGSHVMGYNEEDGTGDVRSVFIRVGEGGQTMVGVVTETMRLPSEDALTVKLRRAHKDIVSIFHNVNSGGGMHLGRENRILWGRESIKGAIGDYRFEISPHSFYQVNNAQTVKLYDTVRDFCDITGGETVLDAYCGVGTIGQYAAKDAKEIIGIETVSEAITDAKKNAKRNNLRNTEYLAGDCERVLPQLVHAGKRPDVVIVDPPRKGCDKAFIKALMDASPKKIV